MPQVPSVDVPLPRLDQAVPFQHAMEFAGMPPAIEKLRNRFGPRDRGAKTGFLYQLRNGRRSDEISIYALVCFERRKIGSIERFVRIYLGPVFLIGNHSAALRAGTRCDANSVHVRRARKNGVMITEKNTVLGKSSERRSELRRDKIWPHAIPDHQHDVLRVLGNFGSVSRR